MIESVTFRVANLPAEFPEGTFDLIVLSEVLYYFDKPDLARVARSCSNAISQDGEIVLCHWLGETDYPLTGVEASELFARDIKPALPVRSILHDCDLSSGKIFRSLGGIRSCRTIIFAMAIWRGRSDGRKGPRTFQCRTAIADGFPGIFKRNGMLAVEQAWRSRSVPASAAGQARTPAHASIAPEEFP